MLKEELEAAVLARSESEARYRMTIELAREEGWTNAEIARVCGVTEAAIRLYRKRHLTRVKEPA